MLFRSGIVSGGVRFASYREEDPDVYNIPSAYGLVAGLELRKPIYGGFSLFGEGRQSFMFDGSWNDYGTPERNIAFTISELKIGVEYSYPLMQTGLDLFGRVAGQAQYWNGMSDGDSESTGLFGASFMVGIRAGGGSYAADDTGMGHKYPSGFTAGTEVSLLKPYQSEHSVTGFGYDPATLAWIGYQGNNGLGIRGRWWKYNENSSDPASDYSKFKMQTVDIEATQAFTLGSMKGLVFGGLRFANYLENSGDVIRIPSAYGLVAGVELRKPIYGGLSLFGEGRQSLMFDNTWYDDGTPEKNIAFTISELKLGLEYTYPLMETGLDLFGRVAGQAQYWAGVGDADSESTGLFGASFMVGIRAGGGTDTSEEAAAGHKYPRGVTSGVEVSLLKPFASEDSVVGYGFDPTIMIWAAYQHDNGLGIRGRWWKYNEISSNPGASEIDRLKMETIDIEATQAFMLGKIKGLVSGGLRLANFNENNNDIIPSAFGLVAGLELQQIGRASCRGRVLRLV